MNRTVLTFTVFLVLLIQGNIALACSCATPNADNLYKNANSVFVATLRSVELTEVPENVEGNWFGSVVRLESFDQIVVGNVDVEAVYKGSVAPKVDVYTHPNSAACGATLIAGERYIFFSDNSRIVNLCGSFTASDPYYYPLVIAAISENYPVLIEYRPPP